MFTANKENKNPMYIGNLDDLKINYDTSIEEVMFLKERGLSLNDMKALARIRGIVAKRTKEQHEAAMKAVKHLVEY